MSVNNDVTLWLTTGHWSRQPWPQCDIIIDPHYQQLPISVRSNRHQQRDPSHLYIILCNRPATHHSTTAPVLITEESGVWAKKVYY